jgi:uncharacterized membrane protein YkgB
MTYPYKQPQQYTYHTSVKFKDENIDFYKQNPIFKISLVISVTLLISIISYGIYKAIVTF